MKKDDTLIRMRKVLTAKHTRTIRKINKLSAAILKLDLTEDKAELTLRQGEKTGLCFALKVLDRACQTELSLE